MHLKHKKTQNLPKSNIKLQNPNLVAFNNNQPGNEVDQFLWSPSMGWTVNISVNKPDKENPPLKEHCSYPIPNAQIQRLPAVKLFRMFFAHHVKPMRDGRVDADREVVVDDVTRHWIGTFHDNTVRLVIVDRRLRLRWAELYLPPVHQYCITFADHLKHLRQALALVTWLQCITTPRHVGKVLTNTLNATYEISRTLSVLFGRDARVNSYLRTAVTQHK